jgi:hypothetical protein
MEIFLTEFSITIRRMSLFLFVLLVGDESMQGVSAANKESYNTVVSILHSIKSSQYLINADKTHVCHNSYVPYI